MLDRTMTDPRAGRRRNLPLLRLPVPGDGEIDDEDEDEDEYDGGRKVRPTNDDEGDANAYADAASLIAASRSRYAVICDAGSSGTRIYVYRHGNKAGGVPSNGGVVTKGGENDADDGRFRSTSKVERDVAVHVGKKVKPGLSSVVRLVTGGGTMTGDNGDAARASPRRDKPPNRTETGDDSSDATASVSASDAATSYLLPGLLDAMEAIPPEHRTTTPLYVFATGGMRLLPPDVQGDVYDGLAAGLRLSSERRRRRRHLPLVVRRENIRTIDGEEEGYYAALAVNYLAGRVGSDLSCTAEATSASSPATGRRRRTSTAAGGCDADDELVEGVGGRVDVDRGDGGGGHGRGHGSGDDGDGDGDGERVRCGLLGALDLGGASTQIAFPVGGAGGGPLPRGDGFRRPRDATAGGQGGRSGPLRFRLRGGGGGGGGGESRGGPEKGRGAIGPRLPSASRRRPRPVGRSDFHVASLLGYGGDRIRASLEGHLARNALAAATRRRQKLNPNQRHHRNVRGMYGGRDGGGDGGGGHDDDGRSGGGRGASPGALEIANPCYFRGYRGTVATTTIIAAGRDDYEHVNITHLHVGTGDADECRRTLGEVLREIREGGPERHGDGGGGGGHGGGGGGYGRPGDLLSLGAGAAAGASADAGAPVRIPPGSSFYALELYYYVFHFVRFVVERSLSLQTEDGRDAVVGGGSSSNVTRRGSSPDGTAGGRSMTWDLDLDLASVHGELFSSSNPSLPLLRGLAPVVCGWDYAFLVEQRDAYDDLTSPEKLPHRCLEFVYSLLLLDDTFGSTGNNPDDGDDGGCVGGSKGGSGGGDVDVDVHFVDEVGGQGVEWTLGAFLHLLNSANASAWRGGASAAVIDGGDERADAGSLGGEWMIRGADAHMRGVRVGSLHGTERTLAASALAFAGVTYLAKRLKKRTKNGKNGSRRRRAAAAVAAVTLKPNENDFRGLPRRPVWMIPPSAESDSSESSSHGNVLKDTPGIHKRRGR